MKLSELTLSTDHRAVMVDGTWVELPDAIEKIAYIKKECEACPNSTFLSCIQLDDTEDRKATCEMITEVKLFEDMSANPMPQPGWLLEEHMRKHDLQLVDGQLVRKPSEVAPVPDPEPVKKPTLTEKVKGLFNF
jgi:hypothetical protein